ncbi:MAG: serine O-acetyltransferase EpsC [Byssovorax sp.]
MKNRHRYDELEQAIDRVHQSYDSDDPINSLDSAALPNKRAVIDAYHHLEPALFMGYYSQRSLDRNNLRHGIAEHLYAAHDLFVSQIDRALHYQKWHGRAAPGCRLATAEDVVLALMRALPDIRCQLSGDVQAAYKGDPAAESLEEIIFSYPALKAIAAYRVANVLRRACVPMIPRIITEHAHGQTGIDISPGATIGDRFFIDHGTGVVIGETAVIGNDVKLYQGVTLGALSVPNRGDPRKRHPTLEDGVTVYAGATILGGETVIGKGSVIGGNVWLVHSVPPGSKVFGRPRETNNGSAPPEPALDDQGGK